MWRSREYHVTCCVKASLSIAAASRQAQETRERALLAACCRRSRAVDFSIDCHTRLIGDHSQWSPWRPRLTLGSLLLAVLDGDVLTMLMSALALTDVTGGQGGVSRNERQRNLCGYIQFYVRLIYYYYQYYFYFSFNILVDMCVNYSPLWDQTICCLVWSLHDEVPATEAPESIFFNTLRLSYYHCILKTCDEPGENL